MNSLWMIEAGVRRKVHPDHVELLRRAFPSLFPRAVYAIRRRKMACRVPEDAGLPSALPAT